MKRRLIVDGYNVIGSDRRYDASDLDAARALLVEDVAAYAASEGLDAVVVFDGGGNPLSEGRPHRVAGVTVVFSKAGEDADTVVERLAAGARERGEGAVVATSDAQTQFAVMGGAVSRMSSAELAGEMRRADEWREHSPAGSAKSRVEDRIERRIREALHRWARGE